MDCVSRFLRYVSFPTTSNTTEQTVPSNLKINDLANALAEELRSIGLTDAAVDEYGRVYAHLEATPGREQCRTLGLIAHMDTSPDASGENIKPQRVLYQGGDLVLNEELGIWMTAEEFPSLQQYVGQELIVTDGTTLLGADDKAGIAEIVTAAEWFVSHPEVPHGRIAIAFTADEEIGNGADYFDFARFDADFAFTVDGGALGEVEWENFNAANAGIKIHGRNIHPGSAKNIMKNAVLLANEFITMLPAAETPAHTEGYEGFFHVNYIHAEETEGYINLIIRDHDRELFEGRKLLLENITRYLNAKYGENTFELILKDTYYNMREKMVDHMFLIDWAKESFGEVGVAYREIPIRGGTDGAVLSWEGLPCPNLSTGGENFHCVHEYIPVPSLEKMSEMLIRLVQHCE